MQQMFLMLLNWVLIPTLEKVESKEADTLVAPEKSQDAGRYLSRDCLLRRTLTREMFSFLGDVTARK